MSGSSGGGRKAVCPYFADQGSAGLLGLLQVILHQLGGGLGEILSQADLACSLEQERLPVKMERLTLAGQDKGAIGAVVRQHELPVTVFDLSMIPGRQLAVERQLVTRVPAQHDTLAFLVKCHFLVPVPKKKTDVHLLDGTALSQGHRQFGIMLPLKQQDLVDSHCIPFTLHRKGANGARL